MAVILRELQPAKNPANARLSFWAVFSPRRIPPVLGCHSEQASAREESRQFWAVILSRLQPAKNPANAGPINADRRLPGASAEARPGLMAGWPTFTRERLPGPTLSCDG